MRTSGVYGRTHNVKPWPFVFYNLKSQTISCFMMYGVYKCAVRYYMQLTYSLNNNDATQTVN